MDAASLPARAYAAPVEHPADRRLTSAGAFCLIGIAVAHLIDLPGHIQDSPYIAVLFGLLAAASLGLTFLLTRGIRPDLVWPVAGALALGAIIGYVWSRTIGLPQIEDHVGEWREPVGIAALVFEGTLVALSVPNFRARALRIAPAATLVAAGLVLAGFVGGEAGGHGHGEGGGHHANMNVVTASPEQQKWGQRHLDQALRTARERFPTFDAARAAGYEFLPRSFEQQKDLDFWHLTNRRYQEDRDHLNPRRPESLMFWHNPDGQPVLIAYIYRVPRREPNPVEGGPLFTWHVHNNGNGRLGKRKMTHLWLLPKLRDGFAAEMPLKKLSRRYGIPEDGGTGAGVTG